MPTLQQRRIQGVRAWTPARLGLSLWLDASQLQVVADNTNLSSWTDVSGLGNHATQGTPANQPTYKVNTLNGRPVVRFDGAASYLRADGAAAAWAGNKTPHTALVVCNKTDGAGVGDVVAFGSSGPALHNMRLVAGSPTNLWVIRRDDSSTLLQNGFGNVSLSTPHILTDSFDGTLATCYVDGRILGTSFSLSVGTLTLDRVAIGSNTAAANHFAGDIAEVVLVPRALSDAERRAVEVYLSRKWGVAI